MVAMMLHQDDVIVQERIAGLQRYFRNPRMWPEINYRLPPPRRFYKGLEPLRSVLAKRVKRTAHDC